MNMCSEPDTDDITIKDVSQIIRHRQGYKISPKGTPNTEYFVR